MKPTETPEYSYTGGNHQKPPALAMPQGVGSEIPPAANSDVQQPQPADELVYPRLTIDQASELKTRQKPSDTNGTNFVAGALAPVTLTAPSASPGVLVRNDGMHTTISPWKAAGNKAST